MGDRNGLAQRQPIPWMDKPDVSIQAAEEDVHHPVHDQMAKHGAEHTSANGADTRGSNGQDHMDHMSAAERMQQMADALVDDETVQKAETGEGLAE